jgi:DMSO/TMAO reductase YedYZ molybdopterin-dependent catalytic subunit
VRTTRGLWALAGLFAGFAGLATSYLAAGWLDLRDSPVASVAELVIRKTPGKVAEQAIQTLGHKDKPFLVAGVLIILALAFASIGLLARSSMGRAVLGFVVIAAVGVVAASSEFHASATSLVPLFIGFVTWVVVLPILTERLRPQPFRNESRRGFLIAAGVVGIGTVAIGAFGRYAGKGRREVEAARSSLDLSEVSSPTVPAGTDVGLKGISPWQTSADSFYRVDTLLSPPAVAPKDWQLRIHGMVDHPITLTYDDLLQRQRTQAWVTLNCVSNPVGGPLIGNAWWSGVRLKDILEEAGIQPGATAIKQTSVDGWTCGTPVAAVMDGRDAMLAIAMNGSPLPVEHGFPVRTIVPGLYGFVSACKWVEDMEITTYDTFHGYWTDRGWSAQGPVKLASRIDVPGNGDKVTAGQVRAGGVAWQQDIGIKAVEVALDGGSWQPARLGRAVLKDAWVQWDVTLDVPSGHHVLRVRATNNDGEVQTGALTAEAPNGATGWHTISFNAS